MTPDEWAAKVAAAERRWANYDANTSLEQWQAAMTAHAGRAGAWQRMTRRQRMTIRLAGLTRRVRRLILGR